MLVFLLVLRRKRPFKRVVLLCVLLMITIVDIAASLFTWAVPLVSTRVINMLSKKLLRFPAEHSHIVRLTSLSVLALLRMMLFLIATGALCSSCDDIDTDGGRRRRRRRPRRRCHSLNLVNEWRYSQAVNALHQNVQNNPHIYIFFLIFN